MSVQGGRIEVHHDLALLSSVGRRDGRALDGGELGADEVSAQIVKLLLAERLTAETQLENGNAGSVELDDARREDARRQDALNGLADGRDLSDRQIDLHLGLKEDTN